VQGLLALIVAPWAALLAMGAYLQPLYGDLTRIGSYAEKDFGWNKPQLEFRKNVSRVGKYDRYADVLVLGDSFSLGRPLLSWQNYVVAATGWSVLTLDAKEVRLERILEIPVFRDTPPRIFIFESVERQLPHRIIRRMPCEAAGMPAIAHSTAVPLGATTPDSMEGFQDLTRQVKRSRSWSEIKPEYVLNYLRNGLMRGIGADVPTDALIFEMSRQAPFSSTNRHQLLVYKDEVRKVGWWLEMPRPEKVCRIEGLRNRIEANGQTRFVLLLAPDKLTAYADFLSDSSLRDASVLPQLIDELAHVTPRIDRALGSAITRGVEDVYLPDDTHWGSAGHRIAAETLLGFLRR
jgi:hypothetical protein